MTKEEFLKSNKFKIAIPVVLTAMVIFLWQRGYEFGQWLYNVIN